MKRDDIDGGREFDWGRTSKQYSAYRPGYPQAFYATLAALGIGTAGQRVLDLGTGTGVLARAFAANGADVVGVDIAANQIEEARSLAKSQGLTVEFTTCRAEDIDFAEDHFDVIAAGQSFFYFDTEILIPKLLKALKHGGQLILTHLSWLPRKDATARASEDLVLRYNPAWSGADYSGYLPAIFPWAKGNFDLKTFHLIEYAIPFTRESWRGRFIACRGIGAALSDADVARFDAEHAALLARICPDEFTVLHQASIHAYVRQGLLVSRRDTSQR